VALQRCCIASPSMTVHAVAQLLLQLLPLLTLRDNLPVTRRQHWQSTVRI
jgi:hypothetical protein